VSLPRFQPASICVKCHWPCASSRYVAAFVPFDLGERIAVEEHIERQCARCGFRWKESPLDAAYDITGLPPAPANPLRRSEG
jgi:hypothetical protein